MFGEQVVPEVVAVSGAPESRQLQSSVVENFIVHPGTDEWSNYKQKFLETLPHAHIHEITRIQNRWIREQYWFETKRLR